MHATPSVFQSSAIIDTGSLNAQEMPPGSYVPEPPAHFVRMLATHAFEAVEGIRSIAQLGYGISVGAARHLAEQRKLLRESRDLYRDHRHCAPSPGPMHLCRISLMRAESTVVVHTAIRAHAVTLSLEWAHGHWRAWDITVL